MALASVVWTSFIGGEWSQTAQGNHTDPKYKLSMNVCLNGYPVEPGAWVRRSGTIECGYTRGGAAGRVIAFPFEEAQPYDMEFTNGYLRFWNGTTLATTNDSVVVTSISAANPAVVLLASAVTWVTGNSAYFTGLQTTNPLLQNRRVILTKVDTTHFSITDEITGATIDGSTLGSFGGATVILNRVQEVTTPFGGNIWSTVRSVQAENQSVLLQATQPPQILTANPLVAPSAQFAIAPAQFADGPYLDPFKNGVQVTPSATSGLVSLSLSFPTWNPAITYISGYFVTAGLVNYLSLIDQNIGNPIAVTFTGSSASITATNTFAAGNQVIFFDVGGTLPAALTAGTVYFVISTGLSGSAFQVSATNGGSAITMATAGTGTMTVALAPGSLPSAWQVVNANAAINQPPNQPTALGQGFLQSDIGRLVRLFSEPALWSVTSAYSSGVVVTYNPTGNAPTYWQALTSVAAGKVPGADLTNWQLVAPGAALPAIAGVAQSVAAASGPAEWTWGKIVSLVTFTPGNLSGVAQIGNMTSSGGLAAAFNGNTTQNFAASATLTTGSTTGSATSQPAPRMSFVGQNFSGTVATEYAMQSVTVFPPSDTGFATLTSSLGIFDSLVSLTVALYASNTTPATATSGTLQGTTTAVSNAAWNIPNSPLNIGMLPVTVTSADQTTQYMYWWVVLTATVMVTSGSTTFSAKLGAGQVQFVQAAGAGTTGNGCTIELIGPPLLYGTAIRTWRLGAFSNTTGYPTCGTYQDGRIWFSGVIQNRVDACYSNGLAGNAINMAPTDQYGNVTSAHAITAIFNAPDSNPIFWMEPDQQGIIAGTQAGEWLISAPTAGGLSPLNIAVKRVTKIRCANIEPRRTEHTLAFVQTHQRKIVEYFPDVFSGKFTAPNLAEKWKHLTFPGIAEIAYQQELNPILWARCNDGSLIGTVYKRDTLMTSSGPTINGAHHHILGSGRLVQSITAGPSEAGNLDALNMVTLDSVTGYYHVEMMADMFEEGDTLLNAWFLDGAITPTSYTVSSTAVTINGLWPMNGYGNCTAFCGGLDCGDFSVANGTLVLPLYGQPGQGNSLFTAAFVSAFSGAMPIVVGFCYYSQGQIVDPKAPQDTGARNGPAFGKRKRFHNIQAQLVNTQGISFGTSLSTSASTANRLRPAQLKTEGGGSLLAANVLFNGVYKDTLSDDPMGYHNRLSWQILRPFPATVAAIGGYIETADE